VIHTRRVRDLTLRPGQEEGGRPFVEAASGLVRTGGSLCVVADDALALALFPIEGDAPGRLVALLSGDLPDDDDERKARKPDFEALTLVPPFPGAPHGALLALESGSKASRHWAAVWPLDRDGALDGEPERVELSPLYRELGERLPGLNVEGAPVHGDRLLLLQRGNEPGSVLATAALSLAGVLDRLAAGRALDGALVEEVREHDLGTVGEGVRLCFSDAAPLEDGRLVFSAVAEDTERDGALAGAALGVIGPDGEVERIEPLEPAAKVEGVEAALGPDGIDLLLVADADDPDRPSPLLAARLTAG
jgi:hypothetical protein